MCGYYNPEKHHLYEMALRRSWEGIRSPRDPRSTAWETLAYGMLVEIRALQVHDRAIDRAAVPQTP